MTKSAQNTGLAYIFLNTALWALFPILTTMSFTSVPPLWSASIGTFFSMIFFAVVLTIRRQWRFRVSAAGWRSILTACFLIGVLFYATQYIGISRTTPGNAAIVSLMETFFAYLFLSVIGRHEKFVPSFALGACLMVIGAALILIPTAGSSVHWGDLIILLSTMLPPIGNLAMQRARIEVSASFIMFWRSLAGAVFIGLLAWTIEGPTSVAAVQDSLLVLVITGVVILGFTKILWIEAIHRLPITQMSAIGSAAPLFTLLFAFLILGQQPNMMQLLSFFPMAAGMYLLTRKPVVTFEA